MAMVCLTAVCYPFRTEVERSIYDVFATVHYMDKESLPKIEEFNFDLEPVIPNQSNIFNDNRVEPYTEDNLYVREIKTRMVNEDFKMIEKGFTKRKYYRLFFYSGVKAEPDLIYLPKPIIKSDWIPTL